MVSHKYNQAGTYNATVTVKCDDVVDGQNESVTASITVKVSKCPDCERLKAERTRLKAELSQKRTELEKVKDRLRALYRDRLNIKNQIRRAERYIRNLETGKISGDVADEIPIPKKPTGPAWVLKKGVDWVLEQFIAGWREEIKMLKETLSGIERQITPLEILRDRLKGEIEKIEKRIEEIEDEIKSCRYPPEH